jgi:hypothetical protein
MAFGLLALALTIWWCFFQAFHTIKRSDASGIVVVCAVASIVFSVVLIISWKRQWVWVRASRIERRSDPFSYWLAMFAWALIDLVFLCTLASGFYALVKTPA